MQRVRTDLLGTKLIRKKCVGPSLAVFNGVLRDVYARGMHINVYAHAVRTPLAPRIISREEKLMTASVFHYS